MDITDFFGRPSLDTDYAIATTVIATRAPGVTVIDAYDLSKFSDDTPVFFVTYKKVTDPVTDVVSVVDLVSYKALVNVGANTLTNLTVAPGYTDLGNDEGDFIECIPTSFWGNSLINGLLTALNPDGTVKVGQGEAPGVVKQFAGSSAPSSYLLCDGSSYLRSTYSDLFDVIGTTYGAADGTHFNVPDLRSRAPIGVGTGTFSFTFASTDVNTGTEAVAVTASSELITGRKVQLTTTGALPTGLSLATDYYLIVVDSTHVQFATTLANAVAGTAINLTAAGSGTNTATGALTARTLGQKGGEETHANVTAEMPSHTHTSALYLTAANGNEPAAASGSIATGAGLPSNGTGGSGAHNNMQPFLALNYIIKT